MADNDTKELIKNNGRPDQEPDEAKRNKLWDAWLTVLEDPSNYQDVLNTRGNDLSSATDWGALTATARKMAEEELLVFQDGTTYVTPEDAVTIISNLGNDEAKAIRATYAMTEVLYRTTVFKSDSKNITYRNNVRLLALKRDPSKLRQIVAQIFIAELADTDADAFDTPGSIGVENIDPQLFDQALKEAKARASVPPDSEVGKSKFNENFSIGYIKQCFLLSKIKTLGKFYRKRITDQIQKNIDQSIYDKFLYGDSIYPVNWKNPELFMKYMNNPLDLPSVFTTNTIEEQNKSNFVSTLVEKCMITLIKKRDTNNGAEIFDEFKIYSSDDGLLNSKAQSRYAWYAGANDTDLKTAEEYLDNLNDTQEEAVKINEDYENYLAQFNQSSDSFATKYSINVTLDGTNPSTARNDIKVELTIDLADLKAMFTTNPINAINTNFSTSFKFADFILFPFNNLDPNRAKLGSIFKNQYDPNYNRLRIYFSTENDDENTPTYLQSNNVMAYDLALVDHDLSRTNNKTEGLKTTLKVTYRGYSESVCSSPSLDVLVDRETMKERMDKENDAYDQILKSDCSYTEIRQVVSALNTAVKEQARRGRGNIIKSLLSEKKVYGVSLQEDSQKNLLRLYSIEEENGITSTFTNYFSGGSTDIKEGKRPTGYSVSNIASDSPEQITNISTSSEERKAAALQNIYYFYLADLINVAAQNLYQDIDTSDFTNVKIPSEFASGSRYKFILGSINIADPASPSEIINVNLAEIPISYDFFNDWFKETVIDKDLTSLPITVFIRSLLERVVSNILVDICFSSEISDPIMIRSTFVNDSTYESDGITNSQRFFRGICNSTENFLSLIDETSQIPLFGETTETTKFEDTISTAEADTFFPLTKVDVNNGAFPFVNGVTQKPITYICLFPFGRSALSSGLTNKLATDPTIPLLTLNNSGYSWIYESYTFAKTQQQGLREARYFNSSLNQITQLAAVYDFTINLNVMINTLFPGQIIQIQIEGLGDSKQTYADGGSFDMSQNYSLALNLGGFYIITKVNHTYEAGEKEGDGKTSITARWIASGNPNDIIREKRNDGETAVFENNAGIKCETILADFEEYKVQSAGETQR